MSYVIVFLVAFATGHFVRLVRRARDRRAEAAKFKDPMPDEEQTL